MEKICLSQRRIDEIKNVCRKYGNDPGELINILHGVQDTLGYLPKEVQELIALTQGNRGSAGCDGGCFAGLGSGNPVYGPDRACSAGKNCV